jgi:hypothetical protein
MAAPILVNPITTQSPAAFQAGFRQVDGLALNNAVWADVVSASHGITATPGGGQANALLLPAAINRLAIVATAADSVMLPPATGGNQIQVINQGANSVQVFGNINTTDTINGTAGSTGVAQNTTTQAYALYICARPGVWLRTVNALA